MRGHVGGHCLTLPFSQGPQLIVIKVGVSPNTRSRGESMSQESVLAVKGVSVSVLWKALGLSCQPQLGLTPSLTHP